MEDPVALNPELKVVMPGNNTQFEENNRSVKFLNLLSNFNSKNVRTW